MDTKTFNQLLNELEDSTDKVLHVRNDGYSPEDCDRLHNFVAGGEIIGGTPAQACWGYMTKHLVALRDKVMRNDFSNRNDFKEKCTDVINYVKLLWLIGNDSTSNTDKKYSEWTLKEAKDFCDQNAGGELCGEKCPLKEFCDMLENLTLDECAPGDWRITE